LKPGSHTNLRLPHCVCIHGARCVTRAEISAIFRLGTTLDALDAHSTCAIAQRDSGEYVLRTDPCQLLSLGCRTANKPNHVGAGDGAAVEALPVRPRTIRKAK
jgi:hypothetical protein